jgi:hypothetical protein
MTIKEADGSFSCGVCGAPNLDVANIDNAPLEGPTDPQERRDWVIEQINVIGKKFDNYGFNLNQLYSERPMIVALQGNALSMLLIKKGIISKEELDTFFFELMLEKFKEHERVVLPQLREASIKATSMPQEPQNGMPDEIKKLLGPDGQTLL